MSKKFDCIVIGLGGIGSAAAAAAARRGWNTLGLEQYGLVHALGSSHGQTRIIRQAYFEHPDYVPLLLKTCQLWAEIEREGGTRLFRKTGLLQVGPPDGMVIDGVRRSAEMHDLPIQHFNGTELKKRFPAFRFREDEVGLLEEQAGYLLVEECIRAHLQLAKSAGATLMANTPVVGWQRDSSGFRVRTGEITFHSPRLIIATGSWTELLLAGMVDLQIVLKHQYWFENSNPNASLSKNCPIFLFETQSGCFYGFPVIDNRGQKIAEHSGGTPIPQADAANRQLDQTDLQRVQDFIDSRIVGVSDSKRAPRSHSACMYTNSSDQHFVVDSTEPGLAFACGLSGHGFKFAPLLGRALVDLTEGNRSPDMEFLSMNRFNTPDRF